MKLLPEDCKKYCRSESESLEGWTLAVGPSGRIFLSLESDESYHDQIIDTKAKPPNPQIFPSAASVFGTAPQSVFGTPIPPPLPAVFNFGGGSDSLVKLTFGAVENSESRISELTDEKKTEETEGMKPLFSIGIVSGKTPPAQRVSRGRRLGGRKSSPKSPSPKPLKGGQAEQEEISDTISDCEKDHPPSLTSKKKQALSPAVAECQRAVFAAFLWQEGLVDDAIASASHLMRNPDMTKKQFESFYGKQDSSNTNLPDKEPDKESDKEKPDKDSEITEGSKIPASLPPTLNHLVTFWEEISSTVIENSNLSFSPSEVPALAQELLKKFEDEKTEIEKRKKEKDKKVNSAGGGAGGSTMCELCNQSFPDPVTYHMKEAHPGCGRHASGWGYNSKGTFCSGWAGNCGDGGKGGSTWYLMCKPCHSKYLTVKDEAKKKTVKTVPLPKMKTRKPGKPRNLPPISAVQGMIQNAKFLLEIDRISDSAPTTPLAVQVPALVVLKASGLEQQLSSPDDKPALHRADTIQNDKAKTEIFRPSFLRSKSMAVGKLAEGVTQSESDTNIDDPLMSKPSKNLRQLMYNRSRQDPNSKETGYNRVMGFLFLYHDLDGLRASMKHSMRVAGIKSFALEVCIRTSSMI